MYNPMRFSHDYALRVFRMFLATLFLVLSMATPGQAQEGDATDEGLEIPGLILDGTKTRQGRDFFEFFNLRWQEVEGLSYTISIDEFPDSRRGSFIVVKVDENRVFMERLNPLPIMVEESAQRAVRRAAGYLIQKLIAQENLEQEFQF